MPDMTISFTAQQAQRIQDALATENNPTPGIPELKVWVIKEIKNMVVIHERSVAVEAISDESFDPT